MYLGTVSLMFWNSASFCSRVFLVTCVRWYVLVLFDFGILCVGLFGKGKKGRVVVRELEIGLLKAVREIPCYR